MHSPVLHRGESLCLRLGLLTGRLAAAHRPVSAEMDCRMGTVLHTSKA